MKLIRVCLPATNDREGLVREGASVCSRRTGERQATVSISRSQVDDRVIRPDSSAGAGSSSSGGDDDDKIEVHDSACMCLCMHIDCVMCFGKKKVVLMPFETICCCTNRISWVGVQLLLAAACAVPRPRPRQRQPHLSTTARSNRSRRTRLVHFVEMSKQIIPKVKLMKYMRYLAEATFMCC